jgi:large subunit ribosomal protein L25
MSNHAKLSAHVRPEAGSNAVKAVRARDSVPAVIYGSSVQPQNLEINRREFEILLSHAAGESILVDLTVEENGQSVNRLAMVQEVQHHPLRGDVLHVDFHAVSANETIEASIPIEPQGEADGVKNFGGILEIVLRDLAIRCLPKDLPEVLHVDVSGLLVGDAIHVRDIPLPNGVETALDGDITVLSIAPPNVATIAAGEEAAAAAPEVLKEKKAAE